MSTRHSDNSLTIGVVASVALHLIAAVGGAAWSAAAGASSARPTAREFTEPLPLPKPESQRVKLGDPESTATTITWIGYKEFEEHIGDVQRPVDQPPLTMDPPSGPETPVVTAQASAQPSPPTPEPTPEPVEATPATEQAASAPPVQETEAAVTTAIAPEERPAVEEAGAPRPPLTPLAVPQEALDGVRPEDMPATEVVPEVRPIEEPLPEEPVGEESLPKAEPADAGSPAERVEVAPAEEPARDEPTVESDAAAAPPPSPPQPPTPPAVSGGTPGDPGRESDREADLAARKAAAKVRLGKPLAAQGLKIRTVKPRTSHYNAVLARYVDPVVRVSFDRSGVVRNVEFLRRSENPDVDLYVLDAAYQWRAEGPALRELGAGEAGKPVPTVDVDFQIVRPLSGG